MTKKQLTAYLLVILWMVVIFIFSHQPSEVSSSNSLNTIKNITSVLNIEPDENQLELYNSIGRSFMHGFVFFILGILSYRALFIGKFNNIFLLSLIISIGYALFDEIHQLFVPGRAFQGSDLLIDSIGAVIGIYITAKLIDKKL